MTYFYTHTVQPGDNYWLLAHRYHTTPQEIFAVNRGVNPNYLFIGQHIHIPIPVTAERSRSKPTNHCIGQKEVDYRNEMTSLWEEHVAWTRMAIISLVFNLPDVDFVIARLLQNATDMGDMFRVLYGDLAAKTYADLIQEHLLFAADLVKVSLAGDTQAAMDAEIKWYENADQIAKFLSEANPFLTEDTVRQMFYHHLDLTKQEAVFMINEEFQKDIEVYDEIEEQAREMADALSDAMVKAFPNYFSQS